MQGRRTWLAGPGESSCASAPSWFGNNRKTMVRRFGVRRRGGGGSVSGGWRRTAATAVRSRLVPRLVDTSIRVLGQEPLAGVMPTSALIELATLLDGAGFAHLEVSGGGVFDAAVR